MQVTLRPIQLHKNKSKGTDISDDVQHLIKMWEEYYPKIGYHLPWVGYFTMVDEEIIGSCAFTGPPQNGRVEISYWTFKQHEGKGVSTDACKQLVAIAKAANPSIIITAKTAPEENASTSILKRCGFVYSHVVQDHEIGDAWEWIYEGR